MVVPNCLREKALEVLHKGYMGIVRTKALAHTYVWWPSLDDDLTSLVKTCTACQTVRNSPSVAPLHPWIWPSRPWQRIGTYANRFHTGILQYHECH